MCRVSGLSLWPPVSHIHNSAGRGEKEKRKVLLRTARFIMLILAALVVAGGFAHTAELPVKMSYDWRRWFTITTSLYDYFGKVGVVTAPGVIVAGVVTALMIRRRRAAFWWTVAGTAVFVIGFVAGFSLIGPVNAELARSSVDNPPPDWQWLRSRWEYGHVTMFVFGLVGFGALLRSVLVDTPKSR